MGILARMERSAPRANLNTSADLMQLLLSQQGGDSESGERVTSETAMRAAAVQSCVRVVSEDVAKLPCILYRRTQDGGKERATEHPLYRLMKAAPNGWQTAFQYLRMGQSHIELAGFTAAYISRGVDGLPIELLPLHPSRVKVEQNPDWTPRFSVTRRTGSAEVVPAKNILYVPGLSLDGITGVSVITYARETIGTALATEKHAGRFFRNAATPSGVVERPKEQKALSEPAAQRFLETFTAGLSGDKAFRAGLLEEGMTFRPITMPLKDSQFLETRQYNRSEIAGLFRIPPHKIADLSRSTNNNIEQQSLEYLTDSLLPRLVSWEQALSRALLSMQEQDEYFFEFLVDAVLRADFRTRMDGYAVGIQNGILSPNEARGKENLNPRDGGDTYYMPVNMAPSNAPAPQPPRAA